MTCRSIGGALAGVLVIVGGACAPGGQPAEPTPTDSVAASPAPSSTAPSPTPRFPAASRCPVLAPSELPSGAVPGAARLLDEEPSGTLHSWGRGGDRVVVGRGREVVEQVDDPPGFPRDTGEAVVGRDGVPRWVVAVGDPPLGEITYRFVVDGCPYVLWTATGLTWDDALAYASRLSTKAPR